MSISERPYFSSAAHFAPPDARPHHSAYNGFVHHGTFNGFRLPFANLNTLWLVNISATTARGGRLLPDAASAKD